MPVKNKNRLSIRLVIALAVRILGVLSAFLMTLFVTRMLGVDEAGYFFLAYSIISVVTVIGLIGQENTVLRYVGEFYGKNDWGKVNSLLAKSCLIAVTGLIISFIILYLSADILSDLLFNKNELKHTLYTISPAVIFFGLSTVVSKALLGADRSTLGVIVLFVFVPINMMIVFILLGCETAGCSGLSFSIGTCVSFLAGYMFWLKIKKPGRGVVEWSDIINTCQPLWMFMILQQVLQFMSQILLGIWGEANEVAHLAVAQRTSVFVSFFLMAFNMYAAPRYSDYFHNKKHDEFRKLIYTTTRVSLCLAIPVLAIFILLPEMIMGFFGKDYVDGANLLIILSLFQFVNVITGPVVNLLNMTGHEKDMRDIMLLVSAFLFISGLIVIPVYGAVGAAICTGLSLALQNILALIYVKKRLSINIFNYVIDIK